MKKVAVITSFTVSCLLSGCSFAQDDAEPPAADPSKPGVAAEEFQVGPDPSVSADLGPTSATPKSEKPLGPGLQRLADLATRDLSSRLGIAESSIGIIDAEYVTWRDSALGCSEPGHEYMQVLSNGSRIVLSAEKREYHYHSGGNRPPFWCKNPDPIEPLPYAPGEA